MRQFFNIVQKGVAMPHFLTWTHINALLPLKNIFEINYYINISEKMKLSYRQLREKIKSKEYERLSDEAKNKLITNESLVIKDTIPDPILIPISTIQNEIKIKEKQLQSIIIENIEDFMEQLGEGYSYIKNEYKIKIGDNYNYIDILLFNYIYNCFVVVELKSTELKKEYFGQIKIYMNYVDKYLKIDSQNKTIGILLVKENNNYVLYNSDGDIITRTFKLK